jgi:hypothetical protein
MLHWLYFFHFIIEFGYFGVKLDDTAIRRVYTSIKGDTQGKPNNKRHRISRLKIQHQVELCLRVLKHHQRYKSTKVFTNIKYSTTVQKHCILTLWVAMISDAPYFSILLCLTPDDFTRQVESAATQWVNETMNTFGCALTELYTCHWMC